MNKPAPIDHPIQPVLADRWSPRAFADRAVDGSVLLSLLEAARWAPSCFNEQPWRFLVASKHDDPDGFAKLASCLMDGNAWAREAPVLLLSVATTTFTRNDKPNRHAQHDVGLAVGNLAVEATARGLVMHQMAGFDANQARTELGLPENADPLAMIALGYPGDAGQLGPELAERERSPRVRNPLAGMVFGAGWETKPAQLDVGS